MADRFDSAEEMLRWSLRGLRRRAEEGLVALKSVGDPHPLPRVTDGLPDRWSFGALSQTEVVGLHTERGLRFAVESVDKAERALEEGNVPLAIHWTLEAQQTISSTWANWNAASAARLWRYVDKRRKNLSTQARKATASHRKYRAEEIKAWRQLWKDMEANGYSVRRAAAAIARRLSLPPAAEETIRKKISR